MIRFCFENINLHRITAGCDRRNLAALRLCAKVGMRREAEFLKNRFIHDEWVNTVWPAMLSEEHFDSTDAPHAQVRPDRGIS